MSTVEQHGKDRVVFITKKEFEIPSKLLSNIDKNKVLDEDNQGLIKPNGEINFNCPCLGGIASGPCGYQFREAFTCFHYSTNELKGSECADKFIDMQNCMAKYPNLYSGAISSISNAESDSLAKNQITETSSNSYKIIE